MSYMPRPSLYPLGETGPKSGMAPKLVDYSVYFEHIRERMEARGYTVTHDESTFTVTMRDAEVSFTLGERVSLSSNNQRAVYHAFSDANRSLRHSPTKNTLTRERAFTRLASEVIFDRVECPVDVSVTPTSDWKDLCARVVEAYHGEQGSQVIYLADRNVA